jgi:acetyl-CoA carboxylase alpha subunit
MKAGAKMLKAELVSQLIELDSFSLDNLLANRYKRLMSYGEYLED